MGGGARFPYPKHVWTPSGGWWTQPSNWRANTAIIGVGIAAITYATWKFSAEREQRLSDPIKPIPSQLWAKQYQNRQAK